MSDADPDGAIGKPQGEDRKEKEANPESTAPFATLGSESEEVIAKRLKSSLVAKRAELYDDNAELEDDDTQLEDSSGGKTKEDASPRPKTPERSMAPAEVVPDPSLKYQPPRNPYQGFLDQGDGIAKNPGYLPWLEDIEMKSFHDEFSTVRSDELREYYRKHPELDAMLKCFMVYVLQRKPEDVFECARQFFAPDVATPTFGASSLVPSSAKAAKEDE